MRGRVGASMQTDRARVKFVPKRGPECVMSDRRIPEVRKMLRTTMSVAAIARQFGISDTALRGFIKRHNLCHLQERTQMNRLISNKIYEPDYGTDRWKLKALREEWAFDNALAARNK